MLDAQSSGMEVMMNQITLFSISMLCYMLADLDSPFNGYFRVDLSVIHDVIQRLESTYESVARLGSVINVYPKSDAKARRRSVDAYNVTL